MKKILLFLLFLGLFPAHLTAHANVDVQQLIDETPANGTLKLEQGTYEGPFTLTKPITIIGEKGVKIKSKSNGFIAKKVEGITLEQLEFKTKKAPLQIDSSEQVHLEKLTFFIQKESVHLNNITGLTLKQLDVSSDSKKHFSQKPNGIDVFKSNNIAVDGLTMTNLQDGIYFERVEDVSVKSTTSTYGRYGIHFMYGKRIELRENTVTNNVTGLMLMIVEDLTVEKNVVKRQLMINSNGLYLYDVQRATVQQNDFLENTVATVWNQVRNTTFRENVFQSNSTVVEAKRSPDVVVNDNEFIGNILAARSDKHLFILDHNMYDDYKGYDFDRNNIGDTPHQTYTSFGQWMVRKPVYQYFIEAPSVVLLNKMDEQAKTTDANVLIDETPVMPESNDSFTFEIKWLELLFAVASITSVYLIWRKLR